ncbi:MAG TPA: hypothetical protein VFW96_15760 [Thermomicrobiales bacterium]|nr:hypothetical protein [Thermomicrobiales bacterium]
MIAALLLLAAMGAVGVAALRRWAGWLAPLEQFAYGAPLGVVAASLALLALAVAFGLGAATVALVGVASAAVAVALWPDRAAPAGWRAAGRDWLARGAGRSLAAAARKLWLGGGLVPALVIGAFVARWAILWAGALIRTPAGLEAGHTYIWGDWSLHLGDVTSFAYGDNFPPQDTRFPGPPYAYHYLASLTAAALVKLGMTPWGALTLHSFLFSVLIALGLYAFARRLTGSAGAATLTLPLFLFGGGLGWVLTVGAMNRAHSVVGTLLQHPWDTAAQSQANFTWPNVYYALILPQRPYLYGLPLALLILTLLYAATRTGKRGLYLGAGLVAGLLPLAHLGTLLALALITPFLFLLFPTRNWAFFFGAWVAVAVPQLLTQAGGGGGLAHALRLEVGWVAPPDPWPWFWLKNLGAFVPLLLLALAARDLLPRHSRRFLWAFMPVFVIANLVVFQPWDWDNTKILVYWFLAVCILASALLARVWREHRGAALRLLLVGTVLTMLLSGLLIDLNQLLGKDRHLLLTNEEMHLAALVRAETPAHALFAAGLQNNEPVPVLAGRRVLLGYPGWMWSHGYDYAQRQRDLGDIMAFAPDAPALIAQYGIDYVVIGPEERQDLHADEAAYRARYPAVITTEHYAIFKVSGT